jgi:hypothetical protein
VSSAEPARVAAALAATLALLAVASGCGGGARSAGASPDPPVGPKTGWLIAASGTPPTTAGENAAAGSSAWRAADRDTRKSGIDVYVSEQDARPGQVERVYVRARRQRSVRVRLFRIGWYRGRGARLVFESGRLPVVAQPPCTHVVATGLTECNWHATLALPLPASLASGVYIVNVVGSGGRQRDAIFVLEAARPAPVVVHIPTATWQAYNEWGGDSLYPGGRRVLATGTSAGVSVSYDRPYATTTGAGQFFFREVGFVRFLERYGYPVSYVGSSGLDRERGALNGARAVIDVGHSEYWSDRERAAFTRARDAGTSLAFISSDTLAWRVVYAPASAASSEAGAAAHRIIAYKEFAGRDPMGAGRTGAFADGGASLSGVAFVGCINPRTGLSPRVSYRYYDWQPAPALSPPWLFAHTRLTAKSRVASILGYELDERVAATPTTATLVGGGSAPCGIARTRGPRPIGAPKRGQTTLYSARSGALVFATGTLGWGFGVAPLADPSSDVRRPADPRLVALTRNLLGRMLAQRGG